MAKALPLILTAGLAAAIPLSPARAETRTLTLEQVLGKIEDVNLTVLVNRELIEQAEAAVRLTRSGLLPRIDLQVAQSRSDRGANAPSPANRILNSFESGLFGTATLVDLQQYETLRAARQAVQVSRFQFDAAVQTALAAVAAGYFEHLRDRAFDAVIESNIDRAQVLLDLARNQLDAGVATQIDVTRAEAELVAQQQAKLQQETVVLDSALRLKRLLNIPPDVDLQLEEFRVQRRLDPAVAATRLDAILQHRPDFQAALAQLEEARIDHRAAGRERLPTLDGFAQGGLNSDVAFDGDEERFWSVGLQINLPIFEGSRIRANERITLSRVRQQEFQLQDLRNQIYSEFRIALQDVQSQLAQTVVAEKNLALAEEEVRLARVRYEQGVADNRELIDAENRLTSSNFNLVNAVYSYHIARVELARTRGDVRLILDERVP